MSSAGGALRGIIALSPLFPKGFDRNVNPEADAVSENPHCRPPDLRKGKEPYLGRLGDPSSLPSPSAPIHIVPYRRKIRLIETNPKYRHKKITCKGTLRHVFICLRPLPSGFLFGVF